MSAPPLASVHALQWNATGRAFLRVRPLVVAPGMLLTVALLFASDAPRAQCTAVTTGFALMLAFFTYERVSLQRQPLDARRFRTSLLITLAGITLGCAATGGAQSPLVPLAFAPSVTGFAAFGRARASTVFLVASIASCAVLLALPAGVPFPPPPASVRGWIATGGVLTTLALLLVSVTGLTEALRVSGEAVSQLHHEDLQRAHAQARALEEVAGSLAHEIKNPLAAIKGLVQLVTESPQSPRTPQRLEVLSREVARMESLVHDGLAVARPMHASTLEATSVELLLREVALAVEPHAIEHRVNVTIEPTSLRAIVDPRAMRAALVNLARNAIDASAPHSSITLRAQPQPRAIEIDVIDHGHGMPREVLDRIGAPFFTTRARGHGLGVLVARSVVERHGGSLQFESESGRGTRAVITVPHREASTEA